MKIIIAISIFILSLPLVLVNFIYIKPVLGGASYFFLYSAISLYFLFLSVFLFSLTLVFKSRFLKKVLTVSVVIMSSLIIILIINFSVMLFLHVIHDKSEFIIGTNYNKFNSEKWQKADYYGSNQREYMLKDLAQNILPHKNIEEIINLLGAPYAIISEEKTYNSYSNDGNTVFRSNIRDEYGKIESYEEFDFNAYDKTEIKEEIVIYYITGPDFMYHSALYIYFGTDGIFKEYKYAAVYCSPLTKELKDSRIGMKKGAQNETKKMGQ